MLQGESSKESDRLNLLTLSSSRPLNNSQSAAQSSGFPSCTTGRLYAPQRWHRHPCEPARAAAERKPQAARRVGLKFGVWLSCGNSRLTYRQNNFCVSSVANSPPLTLLEEKTQLNGDLRRVLPIRNRIHLDVGHYDPAIWRNN